MYLPPSPLLATSHIAGLVLKLETMLYFKIISVEKKNVLPCFFWYFTSSVQIIPEINFTFHHFGVNKIKYQSTIEMDGTN